MQGLEGMAPASVPVLDTRPLAPALRLRPERPALPAE